MNGRRLVPAFQFAGARSVVASLWSVDDGSTAIFVRRFYGHLRTGTSKDEARREAQIDQIREPSGLAHPLRLGRLRAVRRLSLRIARRHPPLVLQT